MNSLDTKQIQLALQIVKDSVLPSFEGEIRSSNDLILNEAIIDRLIENLCFDLPQHNNENKNNEENIDLAGLPLNQIQFERRKTITLDSLNSFQVMVFKNYHDGEYSHYIDQESLFIHEIHDPLFLYLLNLAGNTKEDDNQLGDSQLRIFYNQVSSASNALSQMHEAIYDEIIDKEINKNNGDYNEDEDRMRFL